MIQTRRGSVAVRVCRTRWNCRSRIIDFSWARRRGGGGARVAADGQHLEAADVDERGGQGGGLGGHQVGGAEPGVSQRGEESGGRFDGVEKGARAPVDGLGLERRVEGSEAVGGHGNRGRRRDQQHRHESGGQPDQRRPGPGPVLYCGPQQGTAAAMTPAAIVTGSSQPGNPVPWAGKSQAV